MRLTRQEVGAIEPRVPDSFRQEVMRSGLLLCKR